MERFQVTVDAMLESIMDRYMELRIEELEQTEAAIKSGDGDTVRMLGHRLKGTGTSYGFPRLTELGVELEAAGLEGRLDDAAVLAVEVRAYIEHVDVVFQETDD